MLVKTKHKIFLASMAFRLARLGRRIRGKGLTGRFRRGGFLWELDLREVVDFMIYLTGSFEPGLRRFLERNIRPGDVTMDIGANVGAHTLTMGRAVGSGGKVYAVEATEYAFAKLRTNIGLNPDIDGRIHPIHCLVLAAKAPEEAPGDSDFIHSSWPFDSDEERHPSHQGICKAVGAARRARLDGIVEGEGVGRLDLVKLDVDGHEWDVLSGGRTTLEQFDPVIVMELAPDYHAPDDERGFLKIHAFLTELGYKFFDFKGRELPTGAEDLAARIPAGSSMNVVVLPRTGRKVDFTN